MGTPSGVPFTIPDVAAVRGTAELRPVLTLSFLHHLLNTGRGLDEVPSPKVRRSGPGSGGTRLENAHTVWPRASEPGLSLLLSSCL